MKLQKEYLFKISLLLIFLLSFSSFKKKKKRKIPISYQNIYNKSKKSILSQRDFNFRLPTSYVPNWSCSGAPPFPNQREIEKKYIDSVKKLNYRIKYLPCGCDYNPNQSKLENYKNCDSSDTYAKIIETTNIVFRQKIYDSLHYTPPVNSTDESEMDKMIYNNFHIRVEMEQQKLKW